PDSVPVQVGDSLQVSIVRDDVAGIFPATAVVVSDQRLGLRFKDLTLAQKVEPSQMTFARADIATDPWNEGAPDTPLVAGRHLGQVAIHGFKVLLRESLWAVVGGRRWRRRAPKAQEAVS